MKPATFAFVLLALAGCGPYRGVDIYDEASGKTRRCAVDSNGQPIQCRDGYLNRDALADRPTSYREVMEQKRR